MWRSASNSVNKVLFFFLQEKEDLVLVLFTEAAGVELLPQKAKPSQTFGHKGRCRSRVAEIESFSGLADGQLNPVD